MSEKTERAKRRRRAEMVQQKETLQRNTLAARAIADELISKLPKRDQDKLQDAFNVIVWSMSQFIAMQAEYREEFGDDELYELLKLEGGTYSFDEVRPQIRKSVDSEQFLCCAKPDLLHRLGNSFTRYRRGHYCSCFLPMQPL